MAWTDWLEVVRGRRTGPRRASHRRAPQGRGIESLEIRNLLSATGGTGTFANGANLAAGGLGLGDAVLGDIDNDGDLDAVGHRTGFMAGFFSNNGVGSFSDSGQEFNTTYVRSVALGDVDADGDLDAVFARSKIGSQSTKLANQLWLNDGHGNFINSGQQLGLGHSYNVKLGDLDGDSDLDVFVADLHDPSTVWFNDGDGHFTDSGQRIASGYAMDVGLGDLDGDGDLDAFVAAAESGQIWLNNGSGGTFTSGGQLPANTINAYDVVLGDLDGDGDCDAVIQNDNYTEVETLLNDGAGHFIKSQRINGLCDAVLGDLDGDGDLDLFGGTNSGNGTSLVYLNDGTGRLLETGQIRDEIGSNVALGNLDNDGDLDAFAGIRVFLNQNDPPEISLPADGGTYELLKSGDDLVLRASGGAEISRAKLGDATQLLIRGSEGDDTLTVDFSGGNPIRAGGITFENSRGDDRLFLIGGSATNAEHSFSGSNEGFVNLDGRTIKYSGVDLLADHLTTTNRASRLGSGNDSVE